MSPSLSRLLKSKLTIVKEHKDGEVQCSCPFRENHPDNSGKQSFYINVDKNAYHCWSCKEGGSVVKLLTTVFDVDFYEAIDIVKIDLTNMLGKVPYEQRFQRTQVSDSTTERQPSVSKDIEHPLPIKPPKWLLERFSKDLLRKFFIGHMYNDYGDLVTTFPVIENRCIVGVAYRVDTPKGKLMWFNKGFKKEYYFYNQPRDAAKLFLVEGQTDTLQTLSNIPNLNVSGILGSYITFEQLKKLEKLESLEEIDLGFDNDMAGMLCTYITGKALQEYLPNVSVFVVPIPDDPGAIKDTKEFNEVYQSRLPFESYLLRHSIKNTELYETLTHKANARLKKLHNF